jgi:hypothetical protein
VSDPNRVLFKFAKKRVASSSVAQGSYVRQTRPAHIPLIVVQQVDYELRNPIYSRAFICNC